MRSSAPRLLRLAAAALASAPPPLSSASSAPASFPPPLTVRAHPAPPAPPPAGPAFAPPPGRRRHPATGGRRRVFMRASAGPDAGDSPGDAPDFGGWRRGGKTGGQLRVLGVCGGIGSGKSLACRLLVDELGGGDGVGGRCSHVDADKLGHEAYAPGSQCVRDIAAEFGRGVLVPRAGGEGGGEGTEEVDRRALGGVVFSDPGAMSRLERIVWPHVRSLLIESLRAIEGEVSASAASGGEEEATTAPPLAVVEAAVLLDAGWSDLFDAVWVVRSTPSSQRQRLMSDRGMDGGDADVRIEAQIERRGMGNLDEEVRRGAVTCVIDNDGTVEELREELRARLGDPGAWRDGKPIRRKAGSESGADGG